MNLKAAMALFTVCPNKGKPISVPAGTWVYSLILFWLKKENSASHKETSFYLWVCAYVCAYVCVCVCSVRAHVCDYTCGHPDVCAHVHTCTRRPKGKVLCLPLLLPALFSETRSLTEPACCWPGLLGSTYVHSPPSGMYRHTWPFT